MKFLGCLYDINLENEILKRSGVGLQNAVNTYQWNLIDGLNKNLDKPIDIINVLPVGVWPKQYSKFKLETKQWSYNGSSNLEIGSINLPIIKQFSRYKKILRVLKDIGENENIIIYSTYMPFLKAIYKLKNNIKITLVITDLPEFYDLGKVSFFKKIIRKIYNIYIYKYLKRIDNFVLLTEQMKTHLGIGNKKYVVIEGLASNYAVCTSEYKEEKKRILLYTGTLHYQFGIKTLLQAFSSIENNDFELWICGSGEAENEIKELAKTDNRIKYFGYVTKTEIYKIQQKSTILINPRTNDGDYTKYSFPSKTLEYMASEKPVLMYKLDGVPNEYDEYLYYVNGNSVDDLKKSIVEVCNKSNKELYDFGQKARQFVLNNKSNHLQTKKIIDMIKF